MAQIWDKKRNMIIIIRDASARHLRQHWTVYMIEAQEGGFHKDVQLNECACERQVRDGQEQPDQRVHLKCRA